MNYEPVILIRLGEIVLKKLNRHKFEQQLMKNLRYRLRDVSALHIFQDQSRVWIESKPKATEPLPVDTVLKRIRDVFGYVSASPVRRFDCDLTTLEEQVRDYIKPLWADGKKHTFKFETRRINKQFELDTYSLNCRLGDLVLNEIGENAAVDVHDPDYTLYVEIRDRIYLYHEIFPARNGLPVGMGGKGMILLSGGIDSPVAGYMMASRGMQLEGIYFHTPPYTGELAKQKVVDLATRLSHFSGKFPLHIVNFTDIQLEINDKCPHDMLTIVMRRMMMRIADRLAEQRGVPCLITGESMGQVASQTVEALATTNAVAERPVFRPLIGIDKNDTVAVARDIDTFETSIRPYDDCCTVFVAKHPKTKPTMRDAERAERDLDIEALIEQGLENVETVYL